ncbi:hypothetical protein IAT38_005675 [Cryptococcus sp. DSM 104549]
MAAFLSISRAATCASFTSVSSPTKTIPTHMVTPPPSEAKHGNLPFVSDFRDGITRMTEGELCASNVEAWRASLAKVNKWKDEVEMETVVKYRKTDRIPKIFKGYTTMESSTLLETPNGSLLDWSCVFQPQSKHKPFLWNLTIHVSAALRTWKRTGFNRRVYYHQQRSLYADDGEALWLVRRLGANDEEMDRRREMWGEGHEWWVEGLDRAGRLSLGKCEVKECWENHVAEGLRERSRRVAKSAATGPQRRRAMFFH